MQRRNGEARAYILLALVLLFVAAAGIAQVYRMFRDPQIEAYRQSKKTLAAQMQQAFQPPTEEQLEPLRNPSGPVPRSGKAGRTVILSWEGSNVSLEKAHFLLPENLRAQTPAEVETVCWVDRRPSKLWQGAIGADLFVVDRQSGEIWIKSYESQQKVSEERTFDPLDGQEFWNADRAFAGLVKDAARGM